MYINFHFQLGNANFKCTYLLTFSSFQGPKLGFAGCVNSILTPKEKIAEKGQGLFIPSFQMEQFFNSGNIKALFKISKSNNCRGTAELKVIQKNCKKHDQLN